MKLVPTCLCVLALPVTVQAGSNDHLVPLPPRVPGNIHLTGNTITRDTRDAFSNYHVNQADSIPSLPHASRDATRTSYKEKISVVRSRTKTYVAGLRATADGENFCSGSLISPTHVLTGTYCAKSNIRWASIGSHYVNGTQDGEQIKVVAILNHPKSSDANFMYDFAVLVLQKPSTFKPVALAKSDDFDVMNGERAAKIGWDDTGGDYTVAYELTRADVQLMSNSECAKETAVSEPMLCSRGTTNITSCLGDYGGPVVVEHASGDVVVGVVSWGDDCDKPGYPSIYSRVSSARAWIESITSGVCFH